MKYILSILIIVLSVSIFANEIKDGEIITGTPKGAIKLSATKDLYLPKLNNQTFANFLPKNSSIIINKDKTGIYSFTEKFTDESWKDNVFFFSSTGGDNLVIHTGGELEDGALCSNNSMFEDTVIYMIDTHFYPIKHYSIYLETFEMNDTEVYISQDMKEWKSLGNIDTLYWGASYDCNFTKPFFIKFHNKAEDKWLCFLNLRVNCLFDMKNEKTFYKNYINTEKDWGKNFDEIQSDCDVLKYSGSDGLLSGDGNATNQYIMKKITAPKATSAEIVWTTIMSEISVSISCDGKNWADLGKSTISEKENFNFINADKKVLAEINKNYTDGYYIKLSKAGINWFALYNFAVTFDNETTFDFGKIKNNIMFSDQNKDTVAEIEFFDKIQKFEDI